MTEALPSSRVLVECLSSRKRLRVETDLKVQVRSEIPITSEFKILEFVLAF